MSEEIWGTFFGCWLFLLSFGVLSVTITAIDERRKKRTLKEPTRR